jgi:hypothetical protein
MGDNILSLLFGNNDNTTDPSDVANAQNADSFSNILDYVKDFVAGNQNSFLSQLPTVAKQNNSNTNKANDDDKDDNDGDYGDPSSPPTDLSSIVDMQYVKFTLNIPKKIILASIPAGLGTTTDILFEDNSSINVTLYNTSIKVEFNQYLLIDTPFIVKNIELTSISIDFTTGELTWQYNRGGGLLGGDTGDAESTLKAFMKNLRPQLIADTDIGNGRYRAFSDPALMETITVLLFNFTNAQFSVPDESSDSSSGSDSSDSGSSSNSSSSSGSNNSVDLTQFTQPYFEIKCRLLQDYTTWPANAKKQSGIKMPQGASITVKLQLQGTLDDLKQSASALTDGAYSGVAFPLQYIYFDFSDLYVYYAGTSYLDIQELDYLFGGKVEIPIFEPQGPLAAVGSIVDLVSSFAAAVQRKSAASSSPLAGLGSNTFSNNNPAIMRFNNFLQTIIVQTLQTLITNFVRQQPILKNIDLKLSLGIS